MNRCAIDVAPKHVGVTVMEWEHFGNAFRRRFFHLMLVGELQASQGRFRVSAFGKRNADRLMQYLISMPTLIAVLTAPLSDVGLPKSEHRFPIVRFAAAL